MLSNGPAKMQKPNEICQTNVMCLCATIREAELSEKYFRDHGTGSQKPIPSLTVMKIFINP